MDFTKLAVWQRAHKLVLTIYSLTGNFPKQEIFVLTSQLRRAAISITSNIAEGYGRKGSLEKIHFHVISIGSAREAQNHIIIAKDLGYISSQEAKTILNDLEIIIKLIYSVIKKLKSNNQ